MRRQRNDIVYEENNEGDSSGCPQSFHLSSRVISTRSRGCGGQLLMREKRSERIAVIKKE